MNMDFSERLKGFDEVWRRVRQNKAANSAQPQPPIQPARKKPQSRAKRFDPGRR